MVYCTLFEFTRLVDNCDRKSIGKLFLYRYLKNNVVIRWSFLFIKAKTKKNRDFGYFLYGYQNYLNI